MANALLEELNEDQKKAVLTTEGYVRVIAGAGSGKTKALTHRYAYLVDELEISPNRILSVTFTNKAANEMKERIIKMVGDIGTPYIMTFHGFCNRFLHSEIEVLDISSKFKIMDIDDQMDILKVVYEELGLNNKDFPYKRALTEIIGAGCKNGQRSYLSNYEELIEKYSSYELNQLMQLAPTMELKLIYGYLREQKRDACLDYEDLLNFALYILKTRKEIRESWENAFDYIQVDEFQDVSLREVELVGILSNKCGNLFVVGDDSQCIYSFRGSDVNCIVHFGEIMDKIQGKHNTVTSIYLTTNYRSTPEILDVSNSLIKHNVNRLDKNLVAVNENGTKVLHYHARNIYNEADWVARKILTLKRNFSDFAILYRSNSSSRAVEEKLMENGIPYEVLSGISFYSRKEVKDVLSVLSIVAFGDNLSFIRMAKTLKLGLGPKKIDVLRELAGSHGTLYDALRKNVDIKTFKSTKAQWLVNFIEELRVYAERETISMLMGRVFTELNLEEVYKESEIERWENLQELKRSAQHYEHSQHEKVDLGEYLSMLSLYTNADKEDKPDTVKLMTIHAAKGLEFPIVFVIGMNEGLMPSSRTVTADMMEEERRIAYVAMTRAKELLFLSDAEGENFDRTYRIPSRFLFNIDRTRINTEGNLDNYLIKQTKDKIAVEEMQFGKPSSNILDAVLDLHKIEKESRVRHSTFGEGTVMQITDDAYVILFDEVGLKGIRKDSKKIEKIG